MMQDSIRLETIQCFINKHRFHRKDAKNAKKFFN